MKHILSLVILVCMLLGMTVPALAAQSSDLFATVGESEQTGVMPASGMEWPTFLVRITAKDEEGAPIAGAVYGIYRDWDNALTAEISTGADGVGVSASISGGLSYDVKEISLPEGFEKLSVSHPVNPSEGNWQDLYEFSYTYPIKKPEPEKLGRIQLLKCDAADGKPLPGAVFGVYFGEDVKIAELATVSDGTAITTDLPVGDYYLLEQTAPARYAISTKRHPVLVEESVVTTVTVENTALPPDPAPTEKPGRLLITKVAEKSGEKLTGATFGVYEALTDKLVTELVTDHFGEATQMLPIGEYYLRELKAPSGYILDTKRVPFRIQSEKLAELTVTNRAVPTEPTPKPDPVPTEKPGRLLVTKVAEKSGEKLPGAVFGVYDALTDEKVDEVTTDYYGEATFSLPAGEYYLRELKAPEGFIRSTDRLVFKLAAGKQKELTVTNKAAKEDAIPTPPVSPQSPTTPTTPDNPDDSGEKPTTPPIADNGQLSLVKKAEGSGERLSGAVFGVYNAQTNGKIGPVSTGADGKAVLSLPAGRYYLLEETAPNGYLKETAKILFTVKSGGTTVVEITNMRDTTAMPKINIPQTGEPFPVGSVLAAAVCFAFAAVLGGALVVRRKRITPAR